MRARDRSVDDGAHARQYSVLGDRFLVTMDKADGLAQSEGGILLTGNAAEGGSILVGVVQAAGEDASKEAPEVAVGNRVLFSKYGTTEVSRSCLYAFPPPLWRMGHDARAKRRVPCVLASLHALLSSGLPIRSRTRR